MPSQTALPPAQPTYILRGHSHPIHTTTFIRQNTRLVTGDSEGWIVVWDLVSKRAVAVWRAHEGVILGVEEWIDGKEEGRLITHGKDNLLLVWKFSESDEAGMSTILPVDTTDEPRRKPWLLYSLEVNTMNFCSFASCVELDGEVRGEQGLVVAVPNILTSETVDIFQLPSTRRLHTIPADNTTKTGMVMALSVFYQSPSQNLTVIAGYESGHTMVYQLINEEWKILYLARCHDQPILSLDVDPRSRDCYLTSSADAIIGKHPIPKPFPSPAQSSGTKPADLGSSAPATNPTPAPTTLKPSLLSTLLASSSSTSTQTKPSPKALPQEITRQTTPLKINQTKHSGQQSLRIRSDGKIFATAGWDSKIRVYSTKTLKEVAVLKWHGLGCFAVDFADIDVFNGEKMGSEKEEDGGDGREVVALDHEKSLSKSDVTRDIKKERLRKVMETHWIAAGSKDGKVSLWDVY